MAAAFAVAPAHAKTLSFPRELPQPQAPAISRDAGLPGLFAADLAAETETFLLAAPDGQLFLAAYAGKNPHNGASVYVLSPLGLDWGKDWERISAQEDEDGENAVIGNPFLAGLHGYSSKFRSRMFALISLLDLPHTATALAEKLVRAKQLQVKQEPGMSSHDAAYNAMQLTVNPMTPIVEGWDATSYQPEDFGKEKNVWESAESMVNGVSATAGVTAYAVGPVMGLTTSLRIVLTSNRPCPAPVYKTTPMLEQYVGEESGSVWGTKVKYLTPLERKSYAVTIRQGKLYDASGTPLDTPRAIFVMDENGGIFASKVQIVGEFHHSSLLAGEAVAAAGEMSVSRGMLLTLSRKSGHYQPTAALFRQFLRELKRRQVDLSGTAVQKGIQ